MISENNIRERSRALLDAYTELTGCGATPSIDGFLAIRAAAVSEISAGIGGAAAQQTRTTREPSPIETIPQPDAKSTIEVPQAGGSGAEVRRTEWVEIPDTDTDTDIVNSAPLSAFEILRNASDPWNE